MTTVNSKRIAVTGASGFVGSHIALTLKEAGADVLGVVRNPDKGAFLSDKGVELIRADLKDPNSLIAAFSNCDVVVSNAALATRGRATWREFYNANVKGTENVFEAIAAAKVPRAIQISTIGVYRMGMSGTIDEQTPLRQGFVCDPSLLTTNWRYAATKSLGEQAAWEIARDKGIQLTSLRPGPIYGSRDHKMTSTLLRKLDRSFLVVPKIKLPMVHAGDVSNAVLSSLNNEKSVGKAYNIIGETVDLAELFTLLKQLTSSRCRLFQIPITLGRNFDDTLAIDELGLVYRSLQDGWVEAIGDLS